MAPKNPTRTRTTPILSLRRIGATALLALSLMGSAATTAHAQTSRVLVSNLSQTGQDTTVNMTTNGHAQLFHTGSAADGYRLTSVEVVSEDAQADSFAMQVCEEDGTNAEYPSSTCWALSAPASFAAGTLEFTHTALALAANTNYVVVFSTSNNVTLDGTRADGEDSTGLSDWSIKNRLYYQSGGSWTTPSGNAKIMQIRVNGYEVIRPRVSSIEITSDAGSDRTYGIGDDIEVTVTFDQAVDITGAPQLPLNLTPVDAVSLICAGATNTTTMVCSQTVGEFLPDSTGISLGANRLSIINVLHQPIGTIYATGTTTIAANLDHGAWPANTQHRVDATRPTLVTTGADAPRTTGDGTQVTLTFDENVSQAMNNEQVIADPSKITITTTESGTTTTTTGSTTNIAISEDAHEPTTLTVTLATPVASAGATLTVASAGATLTVALGAGAVHDNAGNANAMLAATAVVNNVSDAEWALTILDANPTP